jgi:3-mercaptopyruvate sulfurtransferase SseA
MGQLMSMATFSGERWTFERVLEHSKKSAKELSESHEYLIDVREENEISGSGWIPNSINIPLGHVEGVLKMPEAFESRARRPFPDSQSEDKLIFTCQSGMRASRAAVTAQSLGFKNVAVYPGSFSEWSSKTKK